MKNIYILILLTLVTFSCNRKTEGKLNSVTRVEEILAEMNNPDSKNVLVISHRGDWRNYPENSIPAIESVIDMGVDIVEIDLKLTKDSVLVLCHDKTIDRTTSGKGFVADMTLDSIKGFVLKRAHGVKTDSLRMPTLKEALLVCKDRVVVNVDHAYDYYDKVIKVTEELGMTGQVLIKGKKSHDDINKKMSAYKTNLIYMPIIDANTDKGISLYREYCTNGIVPFAYEICWNRMTPQVKECMNGIKLSGSKLWVNSLWGSLSGGNDDDRALHNVDDVYGNLVELGATMIQTDRPDLLLGYLKRKGLHN